MTGNDGEIGPLELSAVLDDLGLKLPNEDVQVLMKSIDHDGNDFLSLSEFLKLLKAIAKREFFITGESVHLFSYEGFAKMNFQGLSQLGNDSHSAGHHALEARILSLEARFEQMFDFMKEKLG